MSRHSIGQLRMCCSGGGKLFVPPCDTKAGQPRIRFRRHVAAVSQVNLHQRVIYDQKKETGRTPSPQFPSPLDGLSDAADVIVAMLRDDAVAVDAFRAI